MNYCTRCGRKLPSSGDCPYCTSRYYGRRTQPMIRAVLNASSSYSTLALACFWSISLLCLLVFAVLTVNPLLLLAGPGILTVVGLWLIFGGEGRTLRMGYTLISGSLQIMSILSALVLTALCLICFVAIFLCTSYQSYDDISASLLFLAVGLLLALPVLLVFLHKVRRIATTSRSVLLRSRTTVEVSLYAIGVFLLGAGGLVYAALHVSSADRFLTELRPMVETVIPSPYALAFCYLTGLSWVGMLIPLLLVAASSLYTGAALIRYRVRLYQAKKELKAAAAAAKEAQRSAGAYTEAEPTRPVSGSAE